MEFRIPRRFCSAMLSAMLLVGSMVACDEAKPEKRLLAPAPAPVEEPEPEPYVKKQAPSFSIDEVGPQVGITRATLVQANGSPDALGLEQLKKELSAVKTFIDGKEVKLVVERMAKPDWVSTYVEELGALGAARVDVTTETRGDFPTTVSFYAASRLDKPDPCSLVGSITEDRGTALWRLSGGTARKRQKGMSGPDFSITSDTLLSLKKKCESDVFFVHGAEGVEWGPVYDFAASAVALPEAGIRRAAVPHRRPTLGRPVVLDY